MRFKLQDIQKRRAANIDHAKALGGEVAQGFASSRLVVEFLMRRIESELEYANISVFRLAAYNFENTGTASMTIPLSLEWSNSIASALRLTKYPQHLLHTVEAGLDTLLEEECGGRVIKLRQEGESAYSIEVEIPLY